MYPPASVLTNNGKGKSMHPPGRPVIRNPPFPPWNQTFGAIAGLIKYGRVFSRGGRGAWLTITLWLARNHSFAAQPCPPPPSALPEGDSRLQPTIWVPRSSSVHHSPPIHAPLPPLYGPQGGGGAVCRWRRQPLICFSRPTKKI